MNLDKTKRILAGLALLGIGAAFSAMVSFVLQNERSLQLVMGLLFGLGFSLALQYLIRHWALFTRNDKKTTMASLEVAVARNLSSKFGVFETEEEALRAVQAFGSTVLAVLATSTMIGIFSLVFSVAVYTATLLQVRKVEEQNRLIDVQNYLAEASRRSSLIFLFGNILDKVSDEVKDPKNHDRDLSTELIGRIAALGQAFRPYRFTENGKLIDSPISPERGQLVIALYNSKLSNAAYFAIFNATDLSSADLRAATLHKINLSESKMDKADFTDANLIESNLQLATFKGALFDRARLDKSNLSLVDFGDASLKAADLRGVTDFLEVKMIGADLVGAKLKSGDWQKLMTEAHEATRQYLSRTYVLGAKEHNDINGTYKEVERIGVPR